MFTHHLWEGELTPALFSELNQAGGRVWLLTCWWPTACCVVRKVNCLMFLLLSRNLTNEWSEFIIEKLGFWKAPLACELMKLGLSPFRGWGVTSQWKDKILMTGAQLCIRLWWLWKGKVEPWAQLKHRSSEEKPRFQALWITGRSRLPTHSNKSVGSINEKFPSKLWASFQQPFLGSSFLKMSKLHQVILASPWIHQKKVLGKGQSDECLLGAKHRVMEKRSDPTWHASYYRGDICAGHQGMNGSWPDNDPKSLWTKACLFKQ